MTKMDECPDVDEGRWPDWSPEQLALLDAGWVHYSDEDATSLGVLEGWLPPGGSSFDSSASVLQHDQAWAAFQSGVRRPSEEVD